MLDSRNLAHVFSCISVHLPHAEGPLDGYPPCFLTHQNCRAVPLRQVPGHGDVEVEAVLVHVRVGVPQLLAVEAGPDLEGYLHACVWLAVRIEDSRPPVMKTRQAYSQSDLNFFSDEFEHHLPFLLSSLGHSSIYCRLTFIVGPATSTVHSSECCLWQRSPSSSSRSPQLSNSPRLYFLPQGVMS